MSGAPQLVAKAPARILYLTKVFPYPPVVTGDAVYTRGIIEAWSTVAEVTVLCAVGGGNQLAGASGVRWVVGTPQRTGRARSVPSRFPLIAWKGATRDYRIRLAELLKQPDWDVIVVDNIGTAHAFPAVEKYRAKHRGVRLVYIAHEWETNVRSGKYASYGMGFVKSRTAKLDLAKVHHWESALISRADVVTIINTSDLKPFKRIDASQKYLLLSPGYAGPIVADRNITLTVPRRLLILGGRRSEQKQRVLLNWLKVSHQALTAAGIEMCVVGDITDELRSTICNTYPNVVVVGFVETLESLIAGARAGLIVDTVGGGFKLRLLSHVFQRLPIIGLRKAIDGLPTPEGDGYLAAASLEGLVEVVIRAVDDVEKLNSLHNRAFSDCETEFSWPRRSEILSLLAGSEVRRLLL